MKTPPQRPVLMNRLCAESAVDPGLFPPPTPPAALEVFRHSEGFQVIPSPMISICSVPPLAFSGVLRCHCELVSGQAHVAPSCTPERTSGHQAATQRRWRGSSLLRKVQDSVKVTPQGGVPQTTHSNHKTDSRSCPLSLRVQGSASCTPSMSTPHMQPHRDMFPAHPFIKEY